MVKRYTVILGILAMVLCASMSWGYTVSQWPGCCGAMSPVVFQPGPAASSEIECLKGPVAPSCEAPLVPGALHAALSIPFRALALVATPLMAGQCPPAGPCDCDLGEAAYVTAAVPCTSVGACVAPKGY
jgi:hypothetical protein